MATSPEESTARELMLEFVDRTGVSATAPPQRYLWTDAFAVCNLIGLAQRGESRMRDVALNLISQVHNVLGRHRPDDPRHGWISGLDEDSGATSPTLGGLRIGKPLPERAPDEPVEERLEWERDGQYFHYLTKWMHALHRAWEAFHDPNHRRWAIELARTAHNHFTYEGADGTCRMFWKMSVDLSRPQVASMGHHDPLDALVTYCELGRDELSREVEQMTEICKQQTWATDDPLGIGGLLFDAHRIAHLTVTGHPPPIPDLLQVVLLDVLSGLRAMTGQQLFARPTPMRLGFREIGLAIGLRALPDLRRLINSHRSRLTDHTELEGLLDALDRHQPLADQIEAYWLDPANQATSRWADHRDINEVMLATLLAPAGFLSLTTSTVDRNPRTPESPQYQR